MTLTGGFDVDAVLAGVALGVLTMGVAWGALVGLSVIRHLLGVDEREDF